MKNYKFITKKDIRNSIGLWNVYYHWFLEDFKGIPYENSSHKIKNKIYGERKRKRYEEWKEKAFIKFEKTIYILVYNHDYHEFYVVPLIGEYISKQSYKSGENYRDIIKDYVYYNFIGYFNTKEEAEEWKTNLEFLLSKDKDYKLWQDKIKELEKERILYGLEKEICIKEYDYLEAKELANDYKETGLTDIENTKKIKDKIQKEFNQKFDEFKKVFGQKELVLSNERREARTRYRENGESYFKNFKINW